MIRSFRLRLALLAAALTGLVLCAFGGTSYWFSRDLRLNKAAQEVRENAEREVRRSRTPEDWRRIEAKIAASLGAHNASEIVLLIEDSDGTVLYRSTHWPAPLSAEAFPWPPARHGKKAALATGQESNPQPEPVPATELLSRQANGHRWQFGLASNAQNHVAIGVDTAFIDAEMGGLRNALLLSLPIALLLTGLGAWLFSGRAIRPLHKLIDASHHISARQLDQRIPEQGEDREFAELITVFNAMLARLERSFHQAQRFSADAAHELKTPLAILQGQLERTIASVDAGSFIQGELSSILDEVRRLSTISRKLLLLSQADAGKLRLHCEPYELSAALSELVDDIHLLAPHLKVCSQIAPGLVVQVDQRLFPQILHNLISNAIKYNLDKGWIEIVANATASDVEVSIANASPGMSTADQAHLFERFFRADPAHSRRIEGNGLGLSVAREIARAHRGELSLEIDPQGNARAKLKIPTQA